MKRENITLVCVIVSAISIMGSGWWFSSDMKVRMNNLGKDVEFYREEQKSIERKIDLLTRALLGYNVKEINRSGM